MSAFRPWIMWFFTALFFSYQFIIRVFPGLCVPEIMHKFQIDATEFGLLSSMYYYGYAGTQIPIALLLERCACAVEARAEIQKCMEACVSFREDEGRPFEVGFQEQASNPLKRLW